MGDYLAFASLLLEADRHCPVRAIMGRLLAASREIDSKQQQFRERSGAKRSSKINSASSAEPMGCRSIPHRTLRTRRSAQLKAAGKVAARVPASIAA